MATNELRERVTLTFRLQNIPSFDVLSKSDPMIIVSQLSPDGSKRRVYRSEPHNNDENPVFSTPYETDFFFEEQQNFIMDVYDIDARNLDDLSLHDYIGGCLFSLAQVMSADTRGFVIPLRKQASKDSAIVFNSLTTHTDAHQSKVIISGEIQQMNNLVGIFSMNATELPRRNLFFKGNPRLSLCKLPQTADSQPVQVWQSAIVSHTTSPTFEPGKVNLGKLGDGTNSQFLARIWYVLDDGSTELAGEAKIPFLTIAPQQTYDLNAKHAKLVVSQWRVEKQYQFLEYIRGGLDFNLSIAIDFTASNGQPTDPKSLHFIDAQGRNQYIDAIRAVGNVLTAYCSKQYFPALGYGGYVSLDGGAPNTYHCFPLSLETARPFVNGVEEVVGLYRNALPRLQLSGPTYFHDLVRVTREAAAKPYTANYQHYHILLIITDGVINDMRETIDELVEASDTPLSIIIVGVGNADFGTFMEKLDSDDALLYSSKLGRHAKRDIVQFVPFLRFVSNPNELARETLAEIPQQVLEFMQLHKIEPLPARGPVTD